jgi:hypothetical protein
MRSIPTFSCQQAKKRATSAPMSASGLAFAILIAATAFAVSPAAAGGRCLSWQFHTQKPATCKLWSGSVSGPSQTHLPSAPSGKKPCGFGQKC